MLVKLIKRMLISRFYVVCILAVLMHCAVFIWFLWSSSSGTLPVSLAVNKNRSLYKMSVSVWRWRCIRNEEQEPICIKELANGSKDQTSHAVCALTCGHFGSMLPRPFKAVIGTEVKSFDPSTVTHELHGCSGLVCDRLNTAVQLAMQDMQSYVPAQQDTPHTAEDITLQGNILLEAPSEEQSPPSEEASLHVDITVSEQDLRLLLGTNESYSLELITTIGQPVAYIVALNWFGARHALQTLLQLITYDDISNSIVIITEASIVDKPAFTYRGILLDTSRNFIPVDDIKRTLDSMAFNKLNTFHWHITDSQAFPMHLESLPNMTVYGAYSSSNIYLPSDIQDIVEYANARGIRILPEFDSPAHVGHGWQWGEDTDMGKLVVCLDKQLYGLYCAGPPCGQLNLANTNIYVVLEKIYKEMIQIFGKVDLFHFGGDEVNINCWNSSEVIKDWMLQNGHNLTSNSYYEQWGVFQEKNWKLMQLATMGGMTEEKEDVLGIMWTSHLTKPHLVEKYLNKDQYIIQIWTKGEDHIIGELLKKGYKIIMSNYDAFYLDCGVSSFVGEGQNWCSPYKGWQDVYHNDIATMTNATQYPGQVLGGEACLWTEQADANVIDAKLWPRGAALAERLWSSPEEDYRSIEARLLQHRYRMVQRGVKADRLMPNYCRINQNLCRNE